MEKGLIKKKISPCGEAFSDLGGFELLSEKELFVSKLPLGSRAVNWK